jgi:hypothetical protein
MGSGKRGTLMLAELSQGLPGITPAFGQTLAEAGAVCFEEQKHANGVELQVQGTFQTKYQVFWQQVTNQMLRCYNDEETTTELGAYGVAFLLVLDLTDFTVIQTSRRGTGFDYWLGTAEDSEGLPFQNKERLEVSGIRSGDSNLVRARVNQKLKQVEPSNYTALPALIVVVEFSAPLSQVVRNERSS